MYSFLPVMDFISLKKICPLQLTFYYSHFPFSRWSPRQYEEKAACLNVSQQLSRGRSSDVPICVEHSRGVLSGALCSAHLSHDSGKHL